MDAENSLKLVGYYPCAGHGFAMPLYGTAEGANNMYLAICSTSGDHRATISGFEAVEIENQRRLPSTDVIDVAVGEVWRDVFLWNDAVFVGTPDQIWSELTSSHSDLEARAPLSLLDLAVQARRPEIDRIAPVAMSFVEERFGMPKARAWRRQFLRQRIELELRQTLIAEGLPDQLFRAIELVELSDSLCLSVPPAMTGALRESEDVHRTVGKLAAIAALLGATLILPNDDLIGADGEAPARVEASVSSQAVEPVVPNETDDDAPKAADAPTGDQGGRGSLIIWPVGNRARGVTGHLRSQRNPAVSFDPDVIETLMLDGDLLDDGHHRAQIFILVIDDDFADQGVILPEIERTLAKHAEQGSLVLIAPALPANRPSVFLQEDHSVLPPSAATSAHAILDTAIARSPFWWGKPKRSFDRRISDVIQLAMTAGRHPALRRELMQRRRGETVPILSLGLLPEKSGKDGMIDGPGNLRLGSESSWVDGNPKRNDPDIYFSIRMSADGEDVYSHEDRLIAEGRRRTNRFPEFAARVLAPIVEPARGLRDRPLHVEQRPFVPGDLARELQAPDHTAAFTIDGGAPGDRPVQIIMTAETPTLDLVEKVDRLGWSVARYTDTETLRRLAEDLSLRSSFPDQVDLGPLQYSEMHRRLAARGVDQRDVFRVDADMVSEWLSNLPSAERNAAREEGRLRRSAARLHANPNQDYLFTSEFVQSAHPPARQLLKLIEAAGGRRSERRQTRRMSDMHKSWIAPTSGLQRFGLVDGAVPAILFELRDDEVPVEDIFSIDGDLAVPALFRSRAFAVWARATLPAASSWMARFSVSNTFGAFPIVRPFRVAPDSEGRTALVLQDTPLEIAELTQEVNWNLERLQASQAPASWREAHRAIDSLPAQRRLDEIILDCYGLISEATDIEILRRLIKLNKRLD